jgi:hypothetical protein
MTGASEREAAVSLTPVSLDADSRAYRVARSLAETGFRSVVIEGRPSARRFWHPFPPNRWISLWKTCSLT